ncbi:MAG: DoxX family protein [Proteobacteria bacterium]|nr:DoxX family protein [Pseudomonadota bacterium]
MPEGATPLVFPALGDIYAVLLPLAEAALRAFVGFALVPHALRMTCGYFRDTGLPVRNLAMLASHLDEHGWRPGWFWARAIALTQFVGGPLLMLGLFTRPAALAVVVFLGMANIERWRVGGYFWNMLGLEYTLMWTLAAFYFLFRGGGRYSLDHMLIGWAL